jgi:hypothetical protein
MFVLLRIIIEMFQRAIAIEIFNFPGWGTSPEAVFLVVCDPSMNEL